MPAPKTGYSPWENTDDADEAVTAPLDAATPDQLAGFIGELVSISETSEAAKAEDDSADAS